MDLSHLVGNGGNWLHGGGILRAMASAAMPESEEGRQQGSEMSLESPELQLELFGDTGTHVPGPGKFATTLCMVRDAQQPHFRDPDIAFNGGGGWQPWFKRYGKPFQPQEKKVSQPNIQSNFQQQKIGRRLDYGKPWWETGEGDFPKEHSSGVKDARVGQPQIARKRKTTLKEVTNNLSSKEWRRQAVGKLRGKMFAKSTLASKASKRRKLCSVLEKIKGDVLDFFPLSPEELELAGAVLSELQLKAGEQYINEVKLMQLEAGHPWDEVMDRQLAMIKRALRRDAGPDRRAIEVKPDHVEIEDPEVKEHAEEGKPMFPRMAYVFSAVWMLRSGELVNLKSKHLAMDPVKKVVSLTIPKSKMDQGAKGVKRSLVCCGVKPCRSTCPWRISVRVKSWMAGPADDDPMISDTKGKAVSRFHLVKSWTDAIDPQMSGHSSRRSGAMFYTRQGFNLSDIMFLGRWKSAAVFRYMEEAMAEMPVNSRQNFAETKSQEVTNASYETPEDTAPTKISEPLVKGPEINSKAKSTKPLWAISSSRGGKVAHRVGRASWGMPVSEWNTLCGWHFAKANTRVELTRFKEFSIKSCQKCKGLFSLRDNVKGGVELAQLVEI